MGYCYAIIGSGRQGVAAGYDLAKFGDAEEVRMIDLGLRAKESAARINTLLGKTVASGHIVNINYGKDKLEKLLEDVSLFVSAVPFSFNQYLTHLAVRMGVNMVDIGGNTWTTRQQLSFYPMSNKPGVTIVPDCGMGPGMNISLALFAMSLLDKPIEVMIYDGGLPRDPKPPLNYFCSFNINGLLNEYSGKAVFIRNGEVVEVPALSDIELIDFPEPIGTLEAFVTSGGLSTAPWTLLGKLERLENKTLRYPGHCNYFKVLRDLGFLDRNNIVGEWDTAISPYDVLRRILRALLLPEDRDVCVIRIECIGEHNNRPAKVTVQLIDYFDDKTGFTAMQRLTGWHASVVGQMAVAGMLPSGVVPVEMVPGPKVVDEMLKRGFIITKEIKYLS